MSRGRNDPPVDTPGWLGLAIVVLDRHVSVPRGLCVGQAPSWDRDQLDGESKAERDARLAASVTTCRVCPEVTRCPAALRKVPPLGIPRTSP